MLAISIANSESGDSLKSGHIADGFSMSQDRMRQRMKKDRIKRNSQGHLFIRHNGEEKRLIDWIKDDRVTVSETQLRRRVREYELGSLNMNIERILFKPVNKKNRPVEKVPVSRVVRLSEAEKWQKECTRVACDVSWSPALVKRQKFWRLAYKIRHMNDQ